MLFYFRKSSERLDKLQAENHELNGNNARLKSQVRLQGCRNNNLICLFEYLKYSICWQTRFWLEKMHEHPSLFLQTLP